MDWLTVAFLVAGVLLVASEALHLALVPVFLGIAALLVAGLRAIGVVDTFATSLLLWSVLSVSLALPLRPLARRYFDSGVRKYDRSDEVKDALGTLVEVIEPVDDTSSAGRIRFQGTTWAARSTEGTIAAGAQARLFAKDKLVWVVEPLSLLDDHNRVPPLEPMASGAVRDKTRGK